MTDIDGPRLAAEDEFDDLMAMLDRYFSYERGGMAARIPYAYDPDEIDRHAIIKRDGRVVSHVAAVPQTLALGDDDEVECWGFGGVATDKRYRGNGYMSKLLEFQLERMERENVPLADLGGDRRRYNRFGWENTGRSCSYSITERSFRDEPAAADDVAEYRGTTDRVALLTELYGNNPYRIKRDRDRTRTVLGQRGLETLVIEGDEPAYLSATNTSRSRTIAEFGGSARGIETLLAHLFATYDLNELTVRTHPRHPLDPTFQRHSTAWTYRNNRRLNLRDLPATLADFEAQLRRHWRTRGGNTTGRLTLSITEDGAPVTIRYEPGNLAVERTDREPDVELGRIEMTNLLFGYHDRHSDCKERYPILSILLPLNFFVWQSERV